MKKDNIVISVCICTFKRHFFLRRLLENICKQQTNGLFSIHLIVVDNDKAKSAQAVVKEFYSSNILNISYFNEPRQNISLARNMAIANSYGAFIAFIDDDEFPINTWLLNMYCTLQLYKSDVVLGPVLPHFLKPPPEWLVRSQLLERRRFKTGTFIPYFETRTGNVLFTKNVFVGVDTPFNPILGRTGGEDLDFFCRLNRKGINFVWCDDGIVFETVPPKRFSRCYFLKRALLRGINHVILRRNTTTDDKATNLVGIVKSILAFLLYTLALPFLFIAGHHIFMNYLVRYFDHIGKLLALCGIYVLKQRNF